MFRNYIKTAFRAMLKNGAYSLLNIFGLAVGIACAALILLWVEDELTFDHQFEKRDYLYIIKNNQTYTDKTFTFDATPGPLAAAIKAEVPGVKNTARVDFGSRQLFSLGDKAIYEYGVYADSSLFPMLKLPFLYGGEKNAFKEVHSVVISEKMSHRFFGDANPVGKVLKVNNEQPFTVTGVIKDLPGNVSFVFDWLSPFKIFEDKNPWSTQWNSNGMQTFVELQPNANINLVNQRVGGSLTKFQGPAAKPFIYPMKKWRLYNDFVDGKPNGGRIKYVKLFSLIAWIILVIACINFMNLATARSEKRAKEVGVRKVIGAKRSMLIGQFIGESLLMSFISIIVSLGVILLLLPVFNQIVDKELNFAFTAVHIFGLLVIGTACGLLAGSYPAFYLSSFRPVVVLKGLKQKANLSSTLIRKGLVIMQFTISVGLIISTIVIYNQVQYVRSRPLGYNRSNLVYVTLQGNMKQHFGAIRNDLLSAGAVQDAALSTSVVLQLGKNGGGFKWDGADPNNTVLVTQENVSSQYISTMGMKLQSGRNFYPDPATDSTNVIINETFAKLIKKNGDATGGFLKYGNTQFKIVGVVKDFIYNNLYAAASPLVLFNDPVNTNVMTFRINDKSNTADALAKMEAVVKANNPGYPFEYKFIDERFDQFFKAEILIGRLAGIFAVLAIFISCLGLFGLSAFTAERRIREIGIRKVLGASIPGLVTLLSKDFMQMVIYSCFVAFPVAGWLMYKWLQDYEYRTTITWWIFAVSGCGALLIAVFTVSFQAIKAALMNPVKSLRSE